MNSMRKVILLVLVCAATGWADTIHPQVKPMPVISPDLSTSLVMPGTTFSVAIMVGGVSDLSSFQFQFSFNPGVVSVTGISAGTFFPGGSSFSAGAINNATGTIGMTSGLSGTGMSGTGTLAVIYFTALSPGVSGLDLSSVQLLDASGNPINFALANGSVTVTPVTAVPEPTTLCLLLLGAGPVVARHVRKRKPVRT